MQYSETVIWKVDREKKNVEVSATGLYHYTIAAVNVKKLSKNLKI